MRGDEFCITLTIRHGGDSCYKVGDFCQMQSRGFASGEGQIQSDRLSQHTTASLDPTWNAAFGSRICIHAR